MLLLLVQIVGFEVVEVIVDVQNCLQRLQEYNTSLQQYNSKLQSELNQTNEIFKNVEKEKVVVLENLSSLRGHCTSLQDQLTTTKETNNETMKLKEVLESEIGCLRLDLQQVRDERERLLPQVQNLLAEVSKYKDWTGKLATGFQGHCVNNIYWKSISTP
ncbi:hypothetical protein QVD17_12122 [Tagetes erecta]|uniref:Uncharacterized protein n=1 Tax=Tagetes erecta TaxID=13708 RepID=A0AAD8KZ66_TARER|nr:hypothetical protein QVD17_12122 [Tagetes erecta]